MKSTGSVNCHVMLGMTHKSMQAQHICFQARESSCLCDRSAELWRYSASVSIHNRQQERVM